MTEDSGRVPSAPGSHPSGHAGCAVDGASRFDPSRVEAEAWREGFEAGIELERGRVVDFITARAKAHLDCAGDDRNRLPLPERVKRKGSASTCMMLATQIQHGNHLRDSDRSGEAGETGTGSTEGESAGPKGIAQTPPPPTH